MDSTVKRRATEREESCFSRAARAIRRALARICGDRSIPPPMGRCHYNSLCTSPLDPTVYCGIDNVDRRFCVASSLEGYSFEAPDYEPLCPFPTGETSVLEQISLQPVSHFGSLSAPPPQQPSAPHEPSKRKGKSPGGRPKYGKEYDDIDESLGGNLEGREEYVADSSEDVYLDPSICLESDEVFDTEPPPGDNQDVTIDMEMSEAGGLSGIDDSYSAADYHKNVLLGYLKLGSCRYGGASTDPYFRAPKRKDREDGGPTCKSVRKPSCSQSITPTVAEPLCTQGEPAVIQALTGFTEGGVAQDAFEFFSAGSESEPGGGGDVAMETDAPVAAVNYTFTNALPAHGRLPPLCSRRDSSCLSRSRSMPSLSGITSVENKALRRAESSPDMLRSSFEDFTPDIAADENDETYRFQCTCPGLYRCSVTGLLFLMGGEGDVVYRTVPWDRRLLAQHRKKPAGPLFDIKCEQQSVRGLHLPHCEIRSTGGCHFLSVAHVEDEGVEFIGPHAITETHVVVNITGLSNFGNVKDEDSPPGPVRALVLLFYRCPADPDPESLLNVLLLPRNVVLWDVLRRRKELVGDESYIETSPHCKLNPKQEYTLSTRPEDDQILVQPTEAEFDCDDYDNYFPSFQVTWETTLKHIRLLLRDSNSSHSVWERRVCLSSAGGRKSCGPSALDLPSTERLLVIRSRFVEGISGPVLKSLLDKLLEKTVMTDAERESADEMPNKRDKARFVIDTVRKKGEAAGSEMIDILCEADPLLCEDLGLI